MQHFPPLFTSNLLSHFHHLSTGKQENLCFHLNLMWNLFQVLIKTDFFLLFRIRNFAQPSNLICENQNLLQKYARRCSAHSSLWQSFLLTWQFSLRLKLNAFCIELQLRTFNGCAPILNFFSRYSYHTTSPNIFPPLTKENSTQNIAHDSSQKFHVFLN